VPTEDPALPSLGMAARNARARKPPEKYVSTRKGNKYAVAMTQIVALLKDSKHAMAMAQMSVKLMSTGAHRRADVVRMIMAQLSMKASIKKWGNEAKFVISKEKDEATPLVQLIQTKALALSNQKAKRTNPRITHLC
jgi:hypothetical protein